MYHADNHSFIHDKLSQLIDFPTELITKLLIPHRLLFTSFLTLINGNKNMLDNENQSIYNILKNVDDVEDKIKNYIEENKNKINENIF